jgi:hypothetical protein
VERTLPSLWKYGAGFLLFLCLMLGIALKIERQHSANLQAQVVTLATELNQISDARNNQKATTKENIKVVARTIREADERAKRVEQAPPAPNCRTKPEVMNADI